MHRLLHCTDGLFLYHTHTHIQIVLTRDDKPPGPKHTRTPLFLMLLLRFQRTVYGCRCSLNLKIQIGGKLLLIIPRGHSTSCSNMAASCGPSARRGRTPALGARSALSTPDGRFHLCPEGQLNEQHVYTFLSALPVLQ